jgi:uncharacterized protein
MPTLEWGRRSVLVVCLLAALFISPAYALDTSKLQPRGYVNDFARVIDSANAQALEAYCANLERATGAQMTVVTVDSLEDEPIEDVANRLFRQWGIGKKGKDEGLLLMLAIRDRKQRAEVGYGLEPIITDGYAGGVLRGIRPILRQGNYGGALMAAAQEFGSRIAESKNVELTPLQATPAQRGRPRRESGGVFGFIITIVVIAFIVKLISGGGRRGGPGGSGTGFLAGMLLGNLLGQRGGFGGGGFGGYDGGSGGGGFGGFGGGDSGGGGASSGW